MTTAELTADLAYNAADILSAATVQSKTYEIVDVDARAGVLDNRVKIDEISELIQGGVHYIGKTTSTLSDGSETNPITIGDESVTAKQGDMVSMAKDGSQDLEFIFNGTNWYELGSTGSLKALAFKDSVSALYTPAGDVNFTKEDKTAALSAGAATFNAISVEAAVAMDDYTPAGNIDVVVGAPAAVLSVDKVTPTGSVTVVEISAAEFEGNSLTATGEFTGAAATITSTTTLPELPALSVVQPTVNVTAPTASVLETATVTNGVLSFGTTTAVSAVTATATGGSTTYSGTYTQTLSSTASYTPEGNVNVTPGTPSGTITLGEKTTAKTLSINSFTPTGTVEVDAPTVTTATFTGTAAAPTGRVTTTEFTPVATSITGSVTIADVPTSASFSGTPATITAS